MQHGKPSPLRQSLVGAAAAVIVIAVLALVVYDAAILPGCGSCHAKASFRRATAASSHAKVDCRACHVPPDPIGRLAFTMGQPLHMFLPLSGGAVRDAAAVPDSRCLVCHADVEATVVTAKGIRIAHKSCAAGAACSDCHSGTAHGEATPWVRVYEMDRCLACHVSKAKTSCDQCHAGRDTTSRLDSPTFRVTHGPQWRSTHGLGDAATCMVCHQGEDCLGCHGPGVPHGPDFVQAHTKYATDDGAKCEGCHKSAFCDACHGMTMPHDKDFIAAHPKTPVAKQAACRRCHAASDCAVCHEKHVHPGGVIGGVRPAGGGD